MLIGRVRLAIPQMGILSIEMPSSFLTNYALVLVHVSRRPDSTGLEIAQGVGITERAARKIVADLKAAGYIDREKVGRRNRYHVDIRRPLARIGDRELTVGQLLEVVLGQEDSVTTEDGPPE